MLGFVHTVIGEMKVNLPIIGFCLFVYLSIPYYGFSASSLLLAQDLKNETADLVYVQVASARVRSAAKHWASSVAEIKFGDKLQEISRDSNWIKIRTKSGEEGFVHVSAVTERTVVVRGAESADLVRGNDSSIPRTLGVG